MPSRCRIDSQASSSEEVGPGARSAAALVAARRSDEMARLGYPAYVLAFSGVFKLLGAAAIVAPGLPRLKEWAYARLIFDATCAVLSRAALGDPPLAVVAPALIGLRRSFSALCARKTESSHLSTQSSRRRSRYLRTHDLRGRTGRRRWHEGIVSATFGRWPGAMGIRPS